MKKPVRTKAEVTQDFLRAISVQLAELNYNVRRLAAKFNCDPFLPSPEAYIDHRGWRFYPPFICMGCGIEVDARQWRFSKSCGACDVSESRTRRLLYRRCFAGRRELVNPNDQYCIPAEDFVDPKDRESYPVLGQPRRAPKKLFKPTRKKPDMRRFI